MLDITRDEAAELNPEVQLKMLLGASVSLRRSNRMQTVEGPLGCPLGNACFPTDRAPGMALGAQGRYSGSVHGDSRPAPELFAFSPRISDAGTNQAIEVDADFIWEGLGDSPQAQVMQPHGLSSWW
jgi:hypothetical protein